MHEFRLLTKSEANSVKKFFLTTPLRRAISLEFPDTPMTISVGGLSSAQRDTAFEGMETRDFMGVDGVTPIQKGSRSGDLQLHIGRWGDSARIEAVHIVFGSSALNRYFGQVELSTCLTDGHSIYLVKNLTKHGGPGAIKRLDGNGSSPEERALRRERLRDALEAPVIEWEGDEQLVVATIPVKALKEKPAMLLPKVLMSLLEYAGEVEHLRHTSSDGHLVTAVRTRRGFRFAPSAEMRKAIEMAAMDEARRVLEGDGYRVTDVSSDKIGYDLHASKKGSSLCVEVKGTTQQNWAILMTHGEVGAAKAEGSRYVLFVVVLDGADTLRPVDRVRVKDPLRNADYLVSPMTYQVRPRPEG